MNSLKPATVTVCLLARTPFVPAAYAEDEAYTAIMELPDGIEVIHTPDRPRAILGGVSGNRWLLGIYTGRPFTDADFADWYACPDSTTAPTRSCTDSENRSGANRLRSMRTVWFYIGVNVNGETVKGVGELKELNKLANDQGNPKQSTRTRR